MQTIKLRPLSYTDVFENARIIGGLLAPEGFSWSTELARDAPQSPFILHLSCMAHYTPHVPCVAQRIMQKLGLPCPVLGGPENCCGSIHAHLGEPALSKKVARIGIAGFNRARPMTVLSICPDCDESFARHMPQPAPFHHANVSELFVSHLEQLKPMMRRLDRRVVLHAHDHNEARKRDYRNIDTILRSIPGVEVLPATRHRGPGAHCQILAPMSKENQDAMLSEVIALGADTLVVPYHSCYRQHLKTELRYPVRVEHYLTILGASLGIEVEETYKKLRLLDDVDKTVEALRPKFEPLGFSAERIRPLVEWAIYC